MCSMNIARMLECRPGAPRYVIIGNRVDGYQGVERTIVADLRENEMGDTYCAYNFFNEDKCKCLLFELS